MPSLHDFNLLPQDEKLKFTWKHGTFVMNRFDGCTALNLYAVSNFFVEIIYDRNYSRIHSVRSFKSTTEAEPYIEKLVSPVMN